MPADSKNYGTFLKENFHLEQFRPGQKEIISAVLQGRDVLAVLPTGGGKSLCFQFPALWAGKMVVVVSPLIALMKDQVASLARQGIPAACLHSGQSFEERREVFARMGRPGPFLLYLSPERVQKEGFQKWVQNRDFALFAIDEAHCVSQWGHDFREEYAELKILKSLRPEVPILALTASATPTVLQDIARNLKLQKPEKMVHGFYRSNLYYQVEACADDEAKSLMLLQALQTFPQGRVIIYCGTRKTTEELARFLQGRFGKVGFYHAGMSPEERSRTQEAYSRGDLRILAATNAFGMGIDQPDVRLVVHFQMPANIDSLYQEMGRAGRDGKESTCLMLYSRKDKGLQSFFIQSSPAAKDIKDSRWRNLDALVNYSESAACRHAEILTYYRDSQRIDRCGHCDVCDPSSLRRVQVPMPGPSVTTVLRKSRKGNSVRKQDLDQVLSGEQELRFQNLRKWRKEKALELDLPAFVIFNDQTLRALAIRNPQKLDDLKGISGIGDSKLEKFGWDLLAELTN
jgi:ATP-dependent DNA helicase RecQ